MLDRVAVKLFTPATRVRRLLAARTSAIERGSKARTRVAAYRLARWGVHINDKAVIGGPIRMPHPTGIVIGQYVHVEAGVTLFQHVTLGARTRDEGDPASYPTVRTGAVIFAGACVLGPVEVGSGAVVGANSVVLCDVPAGALAVGAPARIIEAGDRPGAAADPLLG